MRNKNALQGVALGMLVAVVVMLGITPVLARSVEMARSSPGAVPQAAPQSPTAFQGPSPLVIPAAAFTSDGSSSTSYFFSFGGGYVRGVNSGCLKAPVYLPRGAHLQQLYASVQDTDAAANLSVELRRVDNYTGAHTLLGSVATSGTGAAIQTPVYTWSVAQVVSYPTYSYYVTTCIPSANFRLYSVRIWYKQPAIWLPLLRR